MVQVGVQSFWPIGFVLQVQPLEPCGHAPAQSASTLHDFGPIIPSGAGIIPPSAGGIIPSGGGIIPPSGGGIIPSGGGIIPSGGGIIPSGGGIIPSGGGIIPSGGGIIIPSGIIIPPSPAPGRQTPIWQVAAPIGVTTQSLSVRQVGAHCLVPIGFEAQVQPSEPGGQAPTQSPSTWQARGPIAPSRGGCMAMSIGPPAIMSSVEPGVI